MRYFASRPATALFLLLFAAKVAAQCPEADAGPDIHYCQGDPNPQLDGSISGPFTSFAWAPPAGLSSVSVLDPTVTVTADKTYTLTANGLNPTQIINGDFEAGNTGFTSAYTYNPVTLWSEGTYTVTDNPMSVHPNFAACGDHTSGSGQMMVVNGSGVAGTVVWGQIIPVLPNMTYRFSYWGCTVVASSPAQQIFRINGVNIGSTFTYPAATCVWQQFFVIWNSGAATSANLQLINQNTALSGNDFAIDDVNFQKECKDVDTVKVFYHPDALKTINTTICHGDSYTVGNETFEESGNYLVNLQTSWGCDSLVQLNLNVINIHAEINPNDPTIDCQNPTVWLTSQGSVIPPGSQFQWTTYGGSIIGNPNGAQITAGSVGDYKLKLTYKNGQLTCIDTALVTVTSAASLPVAEAGPNKAIGCATPTATLSGSYAGGSGFTASWTTPNGHIVSGPMTFSPTVDAAGTYILTVTNPANGCSDKDTVFVTQDLSVPVASAGPADTLDCATSLVTLNGNASTGANFQINWTTANGHFASGQNTLTPTVDKPGQYFLTVQNTANGCTAISSVTISIDTLKPDVDAGLPFTLDCLTTADTIFGNSNSGLPPVWTTTGGHFVSGQNTFQPVVDEAGIYVLKITNPVNHCESTASVEILKNTTLPIVGAGPGATLTCASPTATLTGTLSGGGPNPDINWTTVGGNFLSGQTTLSPIVTTPGSYVLTVINPLNGCSSTASTTVVADPNIPTVGIAAADTLTCSKTSQNLSATTSAGSFQINWTASNGGQITGGGSTLNPTVDKPGTYSVTVLNPANGCSATTSMEVFENKYPPTAAIAQPTQIDCNNAGSLLNGAASSQGGQFSYQWTTTGGQILSGQTSMIAVAGKAGLYVLTVKNNENGCTAQQSATVAADLNYPTTDAGTDKTLDCLAASTTLTATSSPAGPNISINWSTTTGGAISNPNSNSISVSQPGVYVFSIINNTNGCSAADSVEVFQNTASPTAIIGQPGVLTCSTTSLVLNAFGSSTGPDFIYQWTTAGGSIVGAADTSFVEIDKTGQYFLKITNMLNGCTASQSATVTANIQPPTVDAGQSQVLDCQTTSLDLAGSASAGSQLLWSTKSGHFLGTTNSATTKIDASGWYFLTATNPANGCTAIDSVQVTPDAGAPILAVGVSGILTCVNLTQQLNSTATSNNPNAQFQINWTTTGGQFVSGQTTLTPTIDKPGSYLLTVKDLTNGCQSQSSITVSQDVAVPQIGLNVAQVLSCAVASATITATVTTTGGDFNFNWATQTGQFSGGTNSLTPTAVKSGQYSISATDQSSGCTASASVAVDEDFSKPVVSIAQPGVLTCTTSVLTLNGEASTGNLKGWATIGGNFAGGQSMLKINVDKPGLYVLIMQHPTSGCTATDTVQVLQNTTAPTVSIVKPDTLTCVKTSVPLTAICAGQGALSQNWATANGQISGPTGQLSITVLKIGTYSVTVTDAANGCTATTSAQVFENKKLPPISLQSPGKLTCKDQELALLTQNSASGKPFSWKWAGVFSDLADTLKPKVKLPGGFSLTITDTKNGCTSTASTTVGEDKAVPPVVMGSPSILTCSQPTTDLGGTPNPNGNLLFSWKTTDGHLIGSAASATVEADKTGTYFLTVTDSNNGCTASGSVSVSQDKLAAADFEAVSPTCAGQRGSIEVFGVSGGLLPYRFSIDGGKNWQATPDFPSLEPGGYAVAVEDAGGCRIDLPANILPGSTIQIDLEKEAAIPLGGSWVLSATTNVPTSRLTTIQWTPDSTLSCGDCLTTIASPLRTTNYRLFVADTMGCEAVAYFKLKVSRPPVYAPNSIRINGNSSENAHFTIYTDAGAALKISKLMVFDRWGNVMFEQKNFPPNDPALGWGGDFRGKAMGDGVYVWWAEVVWIDGETSFLKGDVTILD